MSHPSSSHLSPSPETRPGIGPLAKVSQAVPRLERRRKKKHASNGSAVVNPPANLPPDEQVRQLQSLVSEKDLLLGTLTQRLEQAADQLDRLRREGAEEVFSAPTPIIAAHHIDDQPELVEDLRLMLDEWRRLQVEGWFGNLNLQLEDLRELVLSRPITALPAAPGFDDVSPEESPQITFTETTPEPQPGPSIPFSGNWEAYKASLLGESYTDLNTADNHSQNASDQVSETASTEGLPERPAPVEFEYSDTASLQQAILERDLYIETLLDLVNTLQTEFHEAHSPPDLNDLSDDQQRKLEVWLSAERDQLRQMQVHISREQARLSRQESQLRHQQQQLDKERKKLNLSFPSEQEDDAENPAPDSQRTGWFSLFGKR